MFPLIKGFQNQINRKKKKIKVRLEIDAWVCFFFGKTLLEEINRLNDEDRNCGLWNVKKTLQIIF